MNFSPESVNHRFITYSDSVVRRECEQAVVFLSICYRMQLRKG